MKKLLKKYEDNREAIIEYLICFNAVLAVVNLILRILKWSLKNRE